MKRHKMTITAEPLCRRVPGAVALMTTDPADVICKWCIEKMTWNKTTPKTAPQQEQP